MGFKAFGKSVYSAASVRPGGLQELGSGRLSSPPHARGPEADSSLPELRRVVVLLRCCSLLVMAPANNAPFVLGERREEEEEEAGEGVKK